MKRILLGLVLVSVIGITIPVSAQDALPCGLCKMAGSDTYHDKLLGQATRGAANIGFGWVELFHQPVKEVKEGGNVLIGFGKGIGHTCLRIIQGAGEIITSPTPRARDGRYTQISDGCPLGVMGLATP